MAGVIDSPLFNRVTQRIHNSKLPRPLSEDEQAEIAYAWDKLAGGQQEVAARHVKIALRAMGFQVNKADVADILQQHGLAPDAGIPWPAFQEVCGLFIEGWVKGSADSAVACERDPWGHWWCVAPAAVFSHQCHGGRVKHLPCS